MRLDAPLSPGLSRGAEQRDATPTNDPLLSPASPRFPEISPLTNQKGPRRGGQEEEDEEDGPLEKSRYYSFHSPDGNTSQTEFQGEAPPPTDASPLGNPPPAGRRAPEREGYPEGRAGSGGSGGDILPGAGFKDRTVVPMTLYQHRVKGLLLALLVEPPLQRDTEAMEEVVSGSC